MTMLVNKARGSVIVAIIFHETINFIAFTMNYPGIYNLHFYLLAALLAILLLPRPLFVDSGQHTQQVSSDIGELSSK